MEGELKLKTTILPVDVHNIGAIKAVPKDDDILDAFELDIHPNNADSSNLIQAANQLKQSDIPVAFPTETVYGLGADATRSTAVDGIYKAKQRPADNPLIVHFASLDQLRVLLRSGEDSAGNQQANGEVTNGVAADPIPQIYRPLISKFWPGPLTIILPNPKNSPLAPEVTAGLNTFGARIPRHTLALALIKLANVPVAAPSANASTKPSPTAAEHVAHDLEGRIETIIDGGPCDVGVESTVVDGLSNPPLVLRPGGISIEQLRSCPGWENTQIGYKNVAESGSQPKAPGMKYRHYSPKALVVLCEAGRNPPTLSQISMASRGAGIITTKRWVIDDISSDQELKTISSLDEVNGHHESDAGDRGFAGMLRTLESAPNPRAALKPQVVRFGFSSMELPVIALGSQTANIARGIFSALRELDREDVSVIYVEGIDESEGETAAAVMNRLRKAAESNLRDRTSLA